MRLSYPLTLVVVTADRTCLGESLPKKSKKPLAHARGLRAFENVLWSVRLRGNSLALAYFCDLNLGSYVNGFANKLISELID